MTLTRERGMVCDIKEMTMTTPRVIHRDKFIRIGKIIVVPYKTIPMLYFDEPWGMISIISSKSCENITTHPGNFCPNLQDRLNLRFNDGAYGGDFNEKIANEILDFEKLSMLIYK